MSSANDPSLLSADALARSLSVRDLTDPTQGPHAMQLLLDGIVQSLANRWGCAIVTHRASPIVSVADNYDRLRYPPDGAARDARYTRYVSSDRLLRTQTSAMIPPLLRGLAERPTDLALDTLLVCPGLVYRRDTIDRLHTGEPHQVDLWRLTMAHLDASNLRDMVATVVEAALPGAVWRTVVAGHPYTLDGMQVDVETSSGWVEVGECGLAHPAILGDARLDPSTDNGLARGLGLDRLLMLAKGIDDIRVLRSTDPRVAGQMLDLSPYRPVSNKPPIRRDISLAVDNDRTPEELGDRVRSALGDRVEQVEAVEVLSETPGPSLSAVAAARLGLVAGQKNVLVRLTIRDPHRTLTHDEANELRDLVYSALHEGTVQTLARQ